MKEMGQEGEKERRRETEERERREVSERLHWDWQQVEGAKEE